MAFPPTICICRLSSSSGTAPAWHFPFFGWPCSAVCPNCNVQPRFPQIHLPKTISVISAFLVQSVHLLHFLLALSAGLVTLLLFTLTFLLVCWLANSRRMAAGLKWYQICRSGDHSFNGESTAIGQRHRNYRLYYLEKQLFDYDANTCVRLHEKLADLRPCFARRLGQLVCGPNFRMLAFALFCVGCIGAGLGAFASSRAELDVAQFVSPRSEARGFLDRLRSAFPRYEDYLGTDDFFKYFYLFFSVLNFEGPIDYWERKEQIFLLLNWPVVNNGKSGG
jgi:hypothetical protein